MKCPICRAENPDSRDICSKCLTDLRGEKKKLGLAITSPDESYENLLKRATGQQVTGQTAKPKPAERPTQPPPPKPAAMEAPMQSEPPKAAPPPRPSRAPSQYSSEEITADLAQAWSEISGMPPGGDLELGVGQFARALPIEELELLFEIASDGVVSQEAERLLALDAFKSSGAELRAERLGKILSSVEKLIDAPVFGLRGARAEKLKAGFRSLVGAQGTGMIVMSSGRIRQAKLKSRLLSALTDLGLCLAAGLACSLLYATFFEPDFMGKLFGTSELEAVDVVMPGAVAAAFALTALLIYPILSIYLSKRTVGMSVAGLQIVSDGGQKLELENILVRSLSFPLSLLCFGWLPLLVARQPLHDRLAKTLVSRK